MIGFLLSFFIIIGFFFIQNIHTGTDTQPQIVGVNADYQSVLSLWQEQIEQQGGEEAYQNFLLTYAHVSPEYQHELAHVFGDALYNTYGISGIEICDQSFSYGCYHAVIGAALHLDGLDTLDAISDDCFADAGCFHGVGHGLVAYFGYEKENLIDAVNLCLELDAARVVDGCLGGVFMEFNMRTMHAVYSGVTHRAPDQVFDEICHIVDTEAQASCYFWLSQWLLELGYGDAYQRYRSAGNQCSQVESASNKLSCFSGLGYVANYFVPPEYLVPLCESAVTSANPAHQRACLEVAFEVGVQINPDFDTDSLCRLTPEWFGDVCQP